jgi:hypothetical protein
MISSQNPLFAFTDGRGAPGFRHGAASGAQRMHRFSIHEKSEARVYHARPKSALQW